MLETLENSWLEIKKLFSLKFGIEIYNGWLSKLNLVSITSNSLVMSVETLFIKDWITQEFLNGKKIKTNGEEIWVKKGIKQFLFENFNISNIEIIVDRNIKSEIILNTNNIQNLTEHNNVYAIGTELNPLFTFENYVIGESNKLAYSIAQSIIQEENFKFEMNPFFLYGEVGLGKTHLMQAMTWKFKEKFPNKNIVYLSAEKFMYLFVASLQNNDINSFKNKFRNIDILLIDDIQFIAGKEGTQKEFFYTFNTLLSDNKTIIMACNKSPDNLINLDNTLKSRMSSGIIVDIFKPNYEMRLELLRNKAKLLNLVISDEILVYIAQNITTTNRDLEGAIKKLLIHQKFINFDITLEVLKNVLKDSFFANKKVISIENIQNKVAEFFKITREDILSDKRDRQFSFPRQIAFYLAKKITKKSFPEIGKEFGNKNHATVIFACNKIEKELITNLELLNNLSKLEKVL